MMQVSLVGSYAAWFPFYGQEERAAEPTAANTKECPPNQSL